MTDRWDTLPSGGALRPDTPASPGGDAPRPATAGAPGDSAAPPRPAARVDHDAPTAKLPAVPKQAPRKRQPVKKPGPFPVIAGSAGLFFAIAAFLAFQMRAGADPALGKGKPVVVAQAAAPRKVLVRRVIATRIVEHRPRRGATPVGSAPPASNSAAPAAPSAPAPAAAAPAPAPAPAAPLTTQSS